MVAVTIVFKIIDRKKGGDNKFIYEFKLVNGDYELIKTPL